MGGGILVIVLVQLLLDHPQAGMAFTVIRAFLLLISPFVTIWILRGIKREKEQAKQVQREIALGRLRPVIPIAGAPLPEEPHQ